MASLKHLKNTFKRVLFLCLYLASLSLSAKNKYQFQMTDQLVLAQNLISELKFDEAQKIVAAQKTLSNNNIAIPWLEESIIFFKLFITEDPLLYKQEQSNWDNVVNRAKSMDCGDGWYRFVLSDMYLHKALVHFKFDEQFSGGFDVQSAYKYVKTNHTLYPNFLPDNKNFGFLSCVFSTVPSQFQWVTKLIGLDGNMKEGIKSVELYLNTPQSGKEHVGLKRETAFIYAMIQHHLNKQTELSWNIVEPYTRQYKTNTMEAYMRATIAGHTGRNDEMIDILKHKPPYNAQYAFYYLDYMLGLAKLRRLDPDADVYFKIFTIKYKGKHYMKSAYRYLAWVSIINNDLATAKTYYSLATKHGIDIIEEDKYADKEAKEQIMWPSALLKARLLFDGRYYAQSLKVLQAIDAKVLNNTRFKLDYSYRKARVYHETKAYNEAITLYKEVIQKGQNTSYYYAAFSALQLGYIYDLLKQSKTAVSYYKMALDDFPDNKEYESSIEQKTKAALKKHNQ